MFLHDKYWYHFPPSNPHSKQYISFMRKSSSGLVIVSCYQVRYLDQDKVFTVEQITGMLLNKLKETSEGALKKPVVDCVISVSDDNITGERRPNSPLWFH